MGVLSFTTFCWEQSTRVHYCQFILPGAHVHDRSAGHTMMKTNTLLVQAFVYEKHVG